MKVAGSGREKGMKTTKTGIGYLRVSTEGQDLERQRADILAKANKEGVHIREWVEEKISSRKADRKIEEAIGMLAKGEGLWISELSRMARNMMELGSLVHKVQERGATVECLAPERMTIGGKDLKGNIMVMALGLAGQVERDMISERTKSGLASAKAKGKMLGRPKGSKVAFLKAMEEKGISEADLNRMVEAGGTNAYIGRVLGVDWRTVKAWRKAKAKR